MRNQKAIISSITILLIMATATVFGGFNLDAELPFLSSILTDDDLKSETGLWKLTNDQLIRLEFHLTRLCPSLLWTEQDIINSGSKPVNWVTSAYTTHMRQNKDGILTLGNEAVFEVGSIGGLNLRTTSDLVLFPVSDGWCIWIEDIGVLDGKLLAPPRYDRDQVRALPLVLDLLIKDGEILISHSGVVMEVSVFDENQVDDWISGERVLLMDDEKLLNLDRLEEAVEVKRLR